METILALIIDLNEECFSVYFLYFPEISIFSYRKKPRNTEIPGKYWKPPKTQPSTRSTLMGGRR